MIKTLMISFLGASRTGFLSFVTYSAALARCEPHRLFILRSSFAHPSLNLRLNKR